MDNRKLIKLVWVGSLALVAAWCGVTYYQRHLVTAGRLSNKGVQTAFEACAAKAFTRGALNYNWRVRYGADKPVVSIERKSDLAVLDYSFAKRQTTTPVKMSEVDQIKLHISFSSDPSFLATMDGVHDCYYGTYKRRELTFKLWRKLGWQGKAEP